jgi:hypothetical protein
MGCLNGAGWARTQRISYQSHPGLQQFFRMKVAFRVDMVMFPKCREATLQSRQTSKNAVFG